MKALFVAVAVLICALSLPAQTATPAPVTNQGAFSLTAGAIALPGGKSTVAGTLLGQTMAVTSTVSLRATELLAPGVNANAYLGGVVWFPGFLQTQIAKTKLTGLVPYFTASAGLETYSPVGASTTHVAVLAGGGVNYCPTSGMCVHVVEGQYARLPGAAGSTAIVSTGLSISFGSK